MGAPPKIIPTHIRRRILELSRIPHTGYRVIAKTIANEFGKDFKYSHVHIGKFLKGENQPPNLPPVPKQPQSTSTSIPSNLAPRRSTMAAWQMPGVPVHHITQSPNSGSISTLDLSPIVDKGSEEADYSYSQGIRLHPLFHPTNQTLVNKKRH